MEEDLDDVGSFELEEEIVLHLYYDMMNESVVGENEIEGNAQYIGAALSAHALQLHYSIYLAARTVRFIPFVGDHGENEERCCFVNVVCWFAIVNTCSFKLFMANKS